MNGEYPQLFDTRWQVQPEPEEINSNIIDEEEPIDYSKPPF